MLPPPGATLFPYTTLFRSDIKNMRNVPIDRKGGSGSFTKLLRVAHEEIRRDNGRQIILLPEGSRRPPGAEP